VNELTNAYLDIETTGLSPYCNVITVIGVYLENGAGGDLVQLVGDDVTRDNLHGVLDGVRTIYTYNGSRFDLPFIHTRLGTDLNDLCRHHDLMYDCWQRNLRGGFKAVEMQLGIPRKLRGLSGYDAVLLWYRYLNYDDQKALATLLEYNREDVVNLKALRELL